MTKTEKTKYISYMTLKDELKSFTGQGTDLKLDGHLSNASEIAAACVFNEESSYMRDYVRDREGRLVSLNFDKVENL